MDIKQMDVWSLVQNGCFEEACKKADAEYAQTQDIFPLRNKVYALFHLRKYEEAILLTQKLIEVRNGETSTDLIFCGIAKWILNERQDAILLWQTARKSMYKDAAGGIDIEVILYFVALKTSDGRLKAEAIKSVKKILKSKRSVNWPGPLGHYLLGEIEDNALLSYVSNIPILRERHLCQAHFAIAIKELEKNNVNGYLQKLKDSISYGSLSYLEQIYYLAKGELDLEASL